MVSEIFASIAKRMTQKIIKRIIDITAALLGLIILSPLLLFLALLIARKLGRSVFFIQERPGMGAKPFRMIKFRTMSNQRDRKGNLLPDQLRITKLGGLLRKFSLDELPELINVLRGEMSLVGPRPLLKSYLPYYSEREKKRHLVRPGITGLAQVSGRNYLDWSQRLELDVQYVENFSLWLDIKILFQTAWVVLFSKGVSVDSAKIEPSFVDYRKNQLIQDNE